MEKAYDFKVLGQRLKAKGLIQAEESVEEIYAELKTWVKESNDVDPNAIVTMLLGFVPLVDGVVNPLINKIDGQEG